MKNPFIILKKKHGNIYAIIFGTAIVLYWRGVWGLMDTYLFPDNHVLSYAVSFVSGLFLLFINDFKLDEIEEH